MTGLAKTLNFWMVLLVLSMASGGVHATAITPTSGDFENNDSEGEFSTDTDLIEVTKTFGSLASLSFSGTMTGSGTVAVSEEITNDTGETWRDYHVEVSFDVSDDCLQSTSCRDGIMFSTLNGNEFSSYKGLNSTTLFLYGGTVEDGDTLTLGFGLSVVAAEGPLSFTLTQYPTLTGGVPEPASLALVSLGLVGLGARRRKAS